MRATAQNIAFTVVVSISALLLAAGVLALALFALRPPLAAALADAVDNTWWFSYGSAPAGYSPLWRLGGAVLAAVLSLAAAFRARQHWREAPAPLLPFLAPFLFSLAFECLRGPSAWLYAADRSVEASVVLTRIIYWARTVGLLGLLLAALYCADLKYRKYGVLHGTIVVVSFAIAAYIPIDRTVFLAQLTWKLGDEQGVWFVNLVISLLVLAAAASARLTRGDNRCLVVTAGFALLVAARELLFFAAGPLLQACGILALGLGTGLCLGMMPRLAEPRTRRAS
jgi:hypothetical protein